MKRRKKHYRKAKQHEKCERPRDRRQILTEDTKRRPVWLGMQKTQNVVEDETRRIQSFIISKILWYSPGCLLSSVSVITSNPFFIQLSLQCFFYTIKFINVTCLFKILPCSWDIPLR